MTRSRALLRPASIFGRLRLLLAVLFLVGAAAALGAAWLFSTAAAAEAYDRLLISAAVQIAESIQAEQGDLIAIPPDSAFETLALSENDRFFYAVHDYKGALMTGNSDLPLVAPTRRWRTPHLEYDRYAGADVRAVALDHFVAVPNGHGWSRVVVAETLEARHLMAIHLMEKIAAIVLFVSGLGFVASLEAARRALLPLDRIGHALAQRSSHDLAPLKVDSPRETAGLIQAINDTMAKLNERMAKLQAFAAVAAHQIRTPLAAISAQAELLTLDRTAPARRQRIERLRANVAKLSRVTNQLLGQAMISYRADTVPHQQVNLVDLIRNVVHETVPMSLDRDLALEMPSDVGPVEVRGDALSLREAFANLIDNAVAHGSPTTLRVRIDADADGDAVRVVVADDGPGFAREFWEAAHLPFQVPRTERGGAGMGISIASEIARAHGGRLTFGYAADGYFEAVMELPRLGRSDSIP